MIRYLLSIGTKANVLHSGLTFAYELFKASQTQDVIVLWFYQVLIEVFPKVLSLFLLRKANHRQLVRHIPVLVYLEVCSGSLSITHNLFFFYHLI